MEDPIQLTLVAIDDHEADLERLRSLAEAISKWNVSVCTFTDPRDGLAWLAAHRADAVLLDFFLGPHSGIQVAKQIRASGSTIPILLLTGRGDEEVAVEALGAGLADHLPKKALTGAGLERALANALEKHRLRQEIEEHRKRSEAASQERRRQRAESRSFQHVLAHEMRTPLTSIREFVSLVIDGLAGPTTPEQRQFLEIARHNCDLINLHLEDLLDAARLETGKLRLRRRPVALEKLIDHVLMSLAGPAAGKGVRLGKVVERDVPEVSADRQRVIQVLTNLVANAIKFTPAGGHVVVGAGGGEGREHVQVTVGDTGCGIPPPHLPRIFDRHYQVPGHRHQSQRGLGLGLYLCRELVRLHGGEISVESRPGAGSRFTFTLPAPAVSPVESATGKTASAAR